MLNADQKKDMDIVFEPEGGTGILDYVTAWYIKAARLIQGATIRAAFVSTNSITQGEQVGKLWQILFTKYQIKIHFAHRTFSWRNEAKGNAAVHVVIIGFANFDTNNKSIFEYEDIKGEAHEVKVKNINPYLFEGKDLVLSPKLKPLCSVPEILFGSKLVDNGNYLFTVEEKKDFLLQEPESEPFFREILSGDEFINGRKRWCLWLKDISPAKLKELKLTTERVRNVKEFRLKSLKTQTQKSAEYPTLFAELRQPKSDFLLIPLTSSENRKYIPLGFFSNEFIVTNSCSVVADASLFHFGILTSLMHMAWVKYTCGRLESRLRYSNTIVYNNFPWPENPSEKQIKAIETAAQKVLDVRAEFQEPSPQTASRQARPIALPKGEGLKSASLADLYDPLTMPPKLVKAHNELDKAVDLAYRPFPFPNDAKSMEFLFELYEKYTAGLFETERPKRGRGKK